MTGAGPGEPGLVVPGLVVIDKPGGMTSHDVVARVRRLLGTRKVGHAGTLDPMATGVLVLGVGRATRLLGHLMLGEKAYDATIRLGESTTTDDAEGEVIARAPTDGVTEAAAREALRGFVGEIRQVPSTVSAIKVAGVRAYERARRGEQVALEARPVTVHELTVRDLQLPELAVSVRCSSGTYVRAIARDLGAALGVGGHLTALRRTRVGPFGLDIARTLEDLAASPSVLPIAAAARMAFPTVDLTEEHAAGVRAGRSVAIRLPAAGPVALFAPDGHFLALYEQRAAAEKPSPLARPIAVFTG